jgi:predicted nucleic acid-binding protein
MAKFVIGPDVALFLAEKSIGVSEEHQLLAPTLLRSQVLAKLYQAVQREELTKKEANRRLDFIRGLRMRLLGDRVLQEVAWKIAEQLGWPDTMAAEYLALTQLQADAFITLDKGLVRVAKGVVKVERVGVLVE